MDDRVINPMQCDAKEIREYIYDLVLQLARMSESIGDMHVSRALSMAVENYDGTQRNGASLCPPLGLTHFTMPHEWPKSS